MRSLVLNCLLLCALMTWGASACMLKNHTLWLEKQECSQCVAVNATICSGYCCTQDTNFRGRLGRTFMIQRSCVPLTLVYQAACVPGCPQGVDPQLYYPAAHRCGCRRCDMRTHRCLRHSPISPDQCYFTPSTVKGQD